jgi:NADP-dependent 3-hydroxy acid dehydrogenase YdfG
MPQTAVIAGHGPGFCEELAFELAEAGYAVGLIARSEEYLATFADELRDAGHEALAAPLDLTDRTAVSDGFDRIRDELGPVEVVAHTASFHDESSGALDPEWLEENWQLYTHSVLLCFRQVVDDLREHEGTFVCFGAAPEIGDLAYKTAKGGTRSLARALADRYQSEGIHVAHVVVAGSILNPDKYERRAEVVEEEHMDPAAVADTILHLVQQPPRGRTFELDVHTDGRSYAP